MPRRVMARVLTGNLLKVDHRDNSHLCRGSFRSCNVCGYPCGGQVHPLMYNSGLLETASARR